MACLTCLDEAIHDVEVLLDGVNSLAVATLQVLLCQHLATAPGLSITRGCLSALNRVSTLGMRVTLASREDPLPPQGITLDETLLNVFSTRRVQ